MITWYFEAFLLVRPEVVAKFKSKSPLTELFFSIFDVAIRLAVEPFQKVTLEGDMNPLLESLPDLMGFVGFYGKPRIGRHLGYNSFLVKHWDDTKHEALFTMQENGKSCSELVNETTGS